MKKTLYFLPFIFWSILYLFAGFAVSFDSIDFTVYIGLILLLVSGILMSRNNWWGSLLGIFVGVVLIYKGSIETGQIIKETIFGIIMCIYYIICLIITYKSKNN